MLLVVDANIVLSALAAGRITDLLLSPKLELGCPFWKYEKRFADMGEIKSLTTSDLAKLIKSE